MTPPPLRGTSPAKLRREPKMAFVDLKRSVSPSRMGKETTLALADATFSIDKGEFIAVVGPSGCGKSTIMKLVTGLLPASSGEVKVAGAR